MEPKNDNETTGTPAVAQTRLVRPDAEGWWWRYRDIYGWEPGLCLMRLWNGEAGAKPELIWFGPGCGHRVCEINHGEWYRAEMPTRPNAKDQAQPKNQNQPSKT